MPEERIRRVVDHLSTCLFPPTPSALRNLEKEGLSDRCAPVFGNTVVDAFEHLALGKSRVVPTPGEEPFILSTSHRPENVDNFGRLKVLFKSLGSAGFDVVLPLHPRLAKAVADSGLTLPPNVRGVDPLSPGEFHHYLVSALAVVTDSGGVIEEAATAGVPLISVRNSTERPEAMGTFAKLVHLEELGRCLAESTSAKFREWQSELSHLASPFGLPGSSKRISDYIRMTFGSQ